MAQEESYNPQQKFILTGAYISISLVFLTILYEGPYTRYSKHETTFITSTGEVGINYEPPTVTLCMVVPHRQRSNLPDNTPYDDIFQSYVKDKSNWYPGFIKDILFVTDTVKMDYVKANFTMDDFRPVLVDYTRFGICFSADIRKVVKKMGPEVEASYVLNVVFIMEPPSHKKPLLGVFGVQVSDSNEELGLTGPVAILEEAGTMTSMARDGEGVIYTTRPELHDFKTDCDKDNARLSDCLDNYINNQLGGKCRMPWEQKEVNTDLKICSDEFIHSRAVLLEKLKMDGLMVMANITGCQLPCKRLFFRGSEAVRQTPYLVFPQLVESGLVNDSMAAMMMSLPWKANVKRLTEIETYPFSSFVGEVGGYLGMFLGLSFWSTFKTSYAKLTQACRWVNKY